MSTRCNVIVADDHQAVCIFRHMDGYPDRPHGVLETLSLAREYAWAAPRFEAADFSAAIVAGWKRPGGGGIYIDGAAANVNSCRPLIHSDSEWCYVIRPAPSNDPDSRPLVETFQLPYLPYPKHTHDLRKRICTTRLGEPLPAGVLDAGRLVPLED